MRYAIHEGKVITIGRQAKGSIAAPVYHTSEGRISAAILGTIYETEEDAQSVVSRSRAAAAMGSAKSPRKTAAVRENGKKGGRPRKSCEVCGSHPAYRKGICVACEHAIAKHGATRADAHMIECDRRKCKA